MMGVYIKGMEKPENCEICPYAFCHLDTRNCPIIELPDHGDLIDRDALISDTEKRYCAMGCKAYGSGVWARCNACWVNDMQGEIIDAPVVIPAERREDD